jgi:hypothetical protein
MRHPYTPFRLFPKSGISCRKVLTSGSSDDRPTAIRKDGMPSTGYCQLLNASRDLILEPQSLTR